MISINPSEKTNVIDSTHCCIENIIQLKLPSSCHSFSSDKIIKKADRFYIMDSRYNKTVFVFDEKGELLYQLGKKGHAKDEYIDGPKNFSVDDQHNVYIHERNSARIFQYDINGKCVSVKRFTKCIPDNVIITKDKDYVCVFKSEYDGDGERLALYDSDLNIKKSFMPITVHPKMMYNYPLYEYKNNIYYTPLLSDSIIVLKNNHLDKVLRINFNDEFIPDDIAVNAITGLEGYRAVFAHKGVQYIEKFEITDAFIHLIYNYKGNLFHFLKDRINGKTYNSNVYYFAGVGMQSDFTLCEDRLLYTITEENLEWADEQRNIPNWQACYTDTPSKMRDIIDRKYKTPLLVMIKIK